MVDNEKYTDKSVGERIRQVRKDMRLSQEAFAEFLGISQDKVSRLETGKSADSISMLKYISMRTETPLLFFFEGEDIFEYLEWKKANNEKNYTWKKN